MMVDSVLLYPLGQVSLEPVFGWITFAPLALIMLASLWLTLTSTGLSRRRRWVLVALRLMAMLVLLLGMLRPGLITTTARESPGAIAVLMDRSESMTLPSGSSGQSRWDVERDVWAAIVSATALEIGETQLIPFFYDQSLTPALAEELPALNKAYSGKPTGKLTDIGNALAELSRLQVEPPLRGVILMGDATQTVLPPAVDATLVARQMAQLDQPIVVVGIGQQGDSQIRDVAITGMPEHFSAFVKKELRIPLVVSAMGMQNQQVQLKLTLRASGKKDLTIDSRKILVSGPNEKQPVEFIFAVPEVGEYLLEATATPPEDTREQISTNNDAFSFITVREGGVKILYLEGQLRHEQLYLRRSLNESLDFDVDYLYIPERDRKRWPRDDLARRLNIQQYDAFVIGDLDSAALSPEMQTRIKRRVEQGAGILWLGGYHSFSAGGYGTSGFSGLFPVELDQRPQAWDRPIDPRHHITGDIKLKPVRTHPITSLALDPTDNEPLWESLEPLKGMNRLGQRSAMPGVAVLLESRDGEPALVTGEAGRGRVLAFAGDTTWRWWTGGQKKLHQQFWRQAMLWLIRRDALNEGFQLHLDRRRLPIGDTPELSVTWFGGSENKPMPDDIRIELSRDGRWLKNLASMKTSSDARKARIDGLDTEGLYRAALTSTGAEGTVYQTDFAFVVRDESVELSYPSADRQLMDNIVSANEIAGGQLILPEEIGTALDWFRQRQEATKVTTIEKRRLGDASWDAWLYLTIFCLLMSTEWGLRKSWQLP